MVTLNKDGKELGLLYLPHRLDLFVVHHELLYRSFPSEFEVINIMRSSLLVYPNVP